MIYFIFLTFKKWFPAEKKQKLKDWKFHFFFCVFLLLEPSSGLKFGRKHVWGSESDTEWNALTRMFVWFVLKGPAAGCQHLGFLPAKISAKVKTSRKCFRENLTNSKCATGIRLIYKIFFMSFLFPTNEIFQQLLYLVHQKTRIKVQSPKSS